MENKVIAIDFDGTIVEDKFPEIGKTKPRALLVIKKLIREGHTIVIWTCRNYGIINDFIKKNFKGMEQIFIYINENPPDLRAKFGNDPRKLGADLFIDDKALFTKEVDWGRIEKELIKLKYLK